MTKHHPNNPWCRYADDLLLHCRTEHEARALKDVLNNRSAHCKLELHPTKTKIAYCKPYGRRKKYQVRSFDYLGYTFRPRVIKKRNDGKPFTGFLPGASMLALRHMRQTTRSRNFRNRTDLSLSNISRVYNSVLRGWWNYYGNFFPMAMYPVFAHFNRTLVTWAQRKYRKLRYHPRRAEHFVRSVAERQPDLFVHWGIDKLAWLA